MLFTMVLSKNFCVHFNFRHLQRLHETIYKEYEASKQLKPTSLGNQGQISIAGFLSSPCKDDDIGARKYSSQNPKQKTVTESLIQNLIVNSSLPVSIVDNPHFRQFLFDLDSKYNPPCRQMVTNSYIPQAVNDKKVKLQSILDSAHYVTLTADVWTD